MSVSTTTERVACSGCAVVQEVTKERWVFGDGQAVEEHIQEKECPVCGDIIGGEDGA